MTLKEEVAQPETDDEKVRRRLQQREHHRVDRRRVVDGEGFFTNRSHIVICESGGKFETTTVLSWISAAGRNGSEAARGAAGPPAGKAGVRSVISRR